VTPRRASSPGALGKAASIRLNGVERAWIAGTVEDLLREAGHDPARAGIAVAINGEVVPRSTWPSRAVVAEDVVEIVGAVQGG